MCTRDKALESVRPCAVLHLLPLPLALALVLAHLDADADEALHG